MRSLQIVTSLMKKILSFPWLASFALIGSAASLSGQIDLGWQQLPSPELPPSVKLFESTNNLPGGAAIYAVYAEIDVSDPNLELKARTVGTGNSRVTPLEWIENREDEPVYVATNAGFFSNTTSVSIVASDGELIEAGQIGVDTDQDNNNDRFPTRGTFAVLQNGLMDIAYAWPESNGSTGNVLAYPEPNPSPVTAVPDLLFPPGGQIWPFVEAMGGLITLVDDGEITTDADWRAEYIDAGVTGSGSSRESAYQSFIGINPRTVIAYTPDQKLILMVIDGRSEVSRGTTIQETAEIIAFLGVEEALNLDGGGSSVLIKDNDQVLTNPADPAGMRPVATFMVVTRKPLIFDTDDVNFSRSAGWFPTANAGFFGDTETLLANTVAPDAEPTASATYSLDGVPAAQYELSAWWVGSSNRASNTPFTISRPGFADTVVRIDQTSNTGNFNFLGTFHLSALDEITITNNATGDFVAVDAIKLAYVGESLPSISFVGGPEQLIVPNGTLEATAEIASPNSALTLEAVRVYKSVDGGPEILVAEDTGIGSVLEVSYEYTETLTEPAETEITYRWEVEDNRGTLTSEVLEVSIQSFDISIPTLAEERESGREICFDIDLDTLDPGATFTELRIFQTIDGGDEEVFDTIALTGAVLTYEFCYFVEEIAGSEVAFRFEAETSTGIVSDVTYTATVVPALGDFTFGFVSDMNGSFGSTSYDAHVRNAFTFFVNEGVDAVFSGGDMIAGQDSGLSKAEVEAMYTGFRAELYSQFLGAGIPFFFTLGNHDGAIPVDREVSDEFWNDPANKPSGPGVTFVDDSDFPFTYSLTFDADEDGIEDIFYVSLDSGGGPISQEDLDFLDATLATPAAQNARLRVVAGHRPLYTVSNTRNSSGFQTRPRDPILDILEARNVDLFYSGDSAAYYPGKRNAIDLLALAEMAGLGKAYIGESQVPPTAVTRMDFFKNDPYYGENAYVFTTYDILNGYPIVQNVDLPPVLIGFDDGFVIRRDIEVTDVGSTLLSPLNLVPPVFASSASGTADATITSDMVTITGSFAGLSAPLVASPDAIALYRGRHATEDQVRLQNLTVTTADGLSGTFTATFPLDEDFRDGLAVGLYSIQVRTENFPNGELRGQLFNDANSNAPETPEFLSVGDTAVGLKDIPGLFIVEWEDAPDPERSPVSYIYEVARDAAFTDVLISEGTGRTSAYRELTQQQWRDFLGEAADNVNVTFYHRITATDGQSVVAGTTEELILFKDPTPPEGAVEIPAPQYQYDGIIGTIPGFSLYDIAKDEDTGRVWAGNFSSGQLRVWNPDGTGYDLTHPAIDFDPELGLASIEFKGQVYTDFNPLYGIEWHPDGYVILAVGGGGGDFDIWKLDATTGEPLAAWNGDFGSNPSVSLDGKIFHHNVFPANGAYLLEPDPFDSSSYVVVSPPGFNTVLSAGPAVARTSGMSPEGDAIYTPDAGSARSVGVFFSDDGVNFTFQENYQMPAATGSNAVVAGPDRSMYVINNASDFPPRLIYHDFNEGTFDVFWQFFLTNALTSDIRGFHVTSDATELYIGDSADRVFKYSLLPEGVEAVQPGNLPTPALAADDTDAIVGQAIEVTFLESDPGMLPDEEQEGVPDTEAWRTQIAMITLNAVPVDFSDVTIAEGVFTFAASLFPEPGYYEIVVSAPGHVPARVVQYIGGTTPPELTPDTSGNVAGSEVEITFPADSTWESAVTRVELNSVPLDPADYSLTSGVLTINSGVLPIVRSYFLQVYATGYDIASVDQPMANAFPPVLSPDTTNNNVGEDIEITFASDTAWQGAIFTVAVDGIPLNPAQYTVTDGVIIIVGSVFSFGGTYEISVRATAYELAQVTQDLVAPVFSISGTIEGPSGPLEGLMVFLDELLLYPLDGNVIDETGQGNDGNPVGATFVFDPERDQVLDLDGTDDYVELTGVELRGDYTISMWFNPDLISGVQGSPSFSRTFLSGYFDEDNAIRLALDTGTLRASVRSNGVEIGRESTHSLVADEWIHLTIAVKAGESVTYYVNGVDTTGSTNAWSRPVGQGLILGARQPGSAHFDGQIDDFTVWSRTLTPTDAANVFNGLGGPKVLTDENGLFEVDVDLGRSLTVVPRREGFTFDPPFARFENVSADVVADFSGEAGLVVAEPIADIQAVENDDPITLDLSNLFEDATDPSAIITLSVEDNTNPALVDAAISGTDLILTLLPNEFGTAEITIGGTANGKVASDTFELTVIPAAVGKALNLSGGEVVNLGQPAELNFDPDDDSFTFEAWFKVANGVVGTIIAKAVGSSRQYQIFTFDNEILYQIGGNSVTTIGGEALYTPDVWNHVALVVDNSTDPGEVRLYLNGRFVRSSTPGATINDGVDVLIGARRTSGNTGAGAPLNGSVDEVRIWNVARTQAEIQADLNKAAYTDEAGLVAYYTFDEGAPTNVPDITGNGFDGTPVDTEPSDWVNSFAAIGDFDAAFLNPSTGVWPDQTDAPFAADGLTASSAIAGDAFAVFSSNGESGPLPRIIDGTDLIQPSARAWQAEIVNAPEVAICVDLSEIGDLLDSVMPERYVLLYQETVGDDLSILATADSYANDTVCFPPVLLPSGIIRLGVIDTYCAGQGGGDWEFIKTVTIGDIDNDSGPLDTDDFYQDFTNLSTEVLLGQSYEITITGQGWDTDRIYAWVDWDHSGSFDEDERVLLGEGGDRSGATIDSWTSSIEVPPYALTGSTTMRIRHLDAGAEGANSTPCGSSSFGEVEDYTLIVRKPTYQEYENIFLIDLPVDDRRPNVDAEGDFIPNDIEWLWQLDGSVFDPNGLKYTRLTSDSVELGDGEVLEVSFLWPVNVPLFGDNTFRVLASPDMSEGSFVEVPRSDYLVTTRQIDQRTLQVLVRFLAASAERQFVKVEWLLNAE